jgi:hypothetical protein
MTGSEFVDSIIKYLSNFKESMDFRLDDRDVWIVVCDILNGYAKRGLFENMKLDDPTVPDQYATTFTGVEGKGLNIYYDPIRALCYSNLPAKPINLPSRRGYKLIAPVRNMENAFWICDANEARNAMRIMGNSKVLAWPEGKKMYYSKRFDETNAPFIVMILVIAGASSLEMDAELPIDPAMAFQVRTDVINYFLPKTDKELDTTRDAK